MKTKEERDAFVRHIPSIQKIIFTEGGYLGEETNLTVTFQNDDTLCQLGDRYVLIDKIPLRGTMSWNDFLSRLAQIHIERWDEDYTNFAVLDGAYWRLTFHYNGRPPLYFSGSNAYPKNYYALRRLMKELYPKAWPEE